MHIFTIHPNESIYLLTIILIALTKSNPKKSHIYTETITILLPSPIVEYAPERRTHISSPMWGSTFVSIRNRRPFSKVNPNDLYFFNMWQVTEKIIRVRLQGDYELIKVPALAIRGIPPFLLSAIYNQENSPAWTHIPKVRSSSWRWSLWRWLKAEKVAHLRRPFCF